MVLEEAIKLWCSSIPSEVWIQVWSLLPTFDVELVGKPEEISPPAVFSRSLLIGSRLSEKEWGSEMNKDLPMHSFSLLFTKI